MEWCSSGSEMLQFLSKHKGQMLDVRIRNLPECDITGLVCEAGHGYLTLAAIEDGNLSFIVVDFGHILFARSGQREHLALQNLLETKYSIPAICGDIQSVLRTLLKEFSLMAVHSLEEALAYVCDDFSLVEQGLTGSYVNTRGENEGEFFIRDSDIHFYEFSGEYLDALKINSGG